MPNLNILIMKKVEKPKKRQRYLFVQMLLAFMLFFSVNSVYSQDKKVHGTITDESNSPIPGVNILIKGTAVGTVTDIDGKYSLDLGNNENPTLVISYVGYLTEEVQVGSKTEISISMLPDLKSLDEVVVIGYGTQKKSDLTGAVASVSSSQLAKTSSTGTLQALEGKAAGVRIVPSSGMPGAAIYVQVRGVNTITKSSDYGSIPQPIYIIDGIQGDINTINPNDIEHIEVLKDASAQAIYGSSGGNGVVIVTTKQGTKNQKTKVEFSMYRGVQSNKLNVDMCNTEEFIKIYNSLEATKKSRITADPDTLPNTNWWNEISSKAVMEEYNLSVSGGSEKSASYLSLGYFNQDGVVDKTNYKRYTVRVNNTMEVNKKIKVGENIALSATRNQGNDGWGTPMGAINQSPISYVRDTSSSLTSEEANVRNIGWGGWAQPMFNTGNGNPVAGIYYFNTKKGTYAMNGNLFANVELIEGLTYNNNFGFGVNFYEMDDFHPYYFINTTQNNKVITVSRELDRTFKWEWQHVIDYKKTLFDLHNIDVMAAFEASEWFYKGLSGQADSLIANGVTPEYQFLGATLRKGGGVDAYAGGGMGHGSKYSYFGRLNYDFNNFIYAQFTYRYEGSTNFGKDYRFGGFPAFSAGLKFSEFEVVKNNVPYLSFGKVRFGYGHTGNDQIPGTKFSSQVKSESQYGYVFGGSGAAGSVSLAPGNSKLHWEDIITYN
jgi:TonB-linked SusC/RagA family outer membrane protein